MIKNDEKWLKKMIIILHQFHHWKQKCEKNDKKMKKTRGKLQFSISWRIFAPLEAKMMKHDKKMIKNEKNMKKMIKIWLKKW